MIGPNETDLGFTPETDVGFVPEGAPAKPTDWKGLLSGVNEAESSMSLQQRSAYNSLSLTDTAAEAKAGAINQAYVAKMLPREFGDSVQKDWPAVREAFASRVLGLKEGPITDAGLYSAIGGHEKIKDIHRQQEFITASPFKQFEMIGKQYLAHQWDFVGEVGWSLKNAWEQGNKPFAALPEARQLPDVPEMGMSNPALAGTVYGMVKPVVEGLESPVGLATVGTLPALRAGGPAAKTAFYGITGLFTGLMAKATAEGIFEKKGFLQDPNLSTLEKAQMVAPEIGTGLMTVLGGLGTVMELRAPAAQEALAVKLQGRNASEAANILRTETPSTPAEATALQTVADHLESVSEKGIEANQETAKLTGPQITETDSGFVVTDANGRLIDYAASAEEAQNLVERAKQPQEEPVATVEPPASQPVETVPEPSAVGIKNEVVDAELKRMGLPEATHGERITFEEAARDAAKKIAADPSAGDRLVKELEGHPRPVTGQEDALLLHEMNRLRLERDAAERQMIEANQIGDPEDLASARGRVLKASEDFQRAGEVFTRVGTTNAQGLALRNMMMREDYSLAAIEQRRSAANEGKPLTEAQSEEIKSLKFKLDSTQKALDDYMAKRVKQPGKVAKTLSEHADAARERIKARLKEGRASAGIDPADLADYAIVGADAIAKGFKKFADWSEVMVKEFGEAIKPHLQAIFDRATEVRTNESRLQALKTRTARSTAEMTSRFQSGDFTKPERAGPIPLDPEAFRLKADNERVKRLIQQGEMKDRMSNRSVPEKVRDAFLKWVRIGALSWPTVLAKLTGAAIIRTATTPIEQGVGYGLSKLLPALAEKAPREGVPSLTGALRAEAKAVTEGITKGMQGAWDMLRNRDTDLSVNMEKAHLPPSLIDYLGKVHGALKYPTKINEFARSFELRSQHAIREGLDPSDPIVEMRLLQGAWMDSNRAIFMQDNGVVNAYRAALTTLEAKNKQTGKPSVALQLLSTGLQTELPIVKVPSNVIAEASTILTGALTGPVKAAFAYAKGIENLKPGEADAILRLMKKGLPGAALMAIGFFKWQNFGGSWQPGDKRKPDDLQPNEILAGGGKIPSQLLHNPYVSAVQFGATAGRALNSQKIHGKEPDNAQALLAASIGLIEETPFLRETSTLAKYLDPHQAGNALSQKAASIAIPGTVQWLAAQTDKEHPFNLFESPVSRKAKGLEQNLKKGIPGLRQEVPKK